MQKVNITKSQSYKKNADKKKSETQKIINQIKEVGQKELLPEIRKKSEDVSKYIEEKIKDGDRGLTSTQILPLIAKRSIADISVAGRISYTPQELAIAFDIYVQTISKINQFTRFPPSKQTFCLFLGISTVTYKNYLESPEKCEIMRIIEDYITTAKLTSAQLGEMKEISTMFELKASHGWVEAQAPMVVEHKKSTDIDTIKAKIASIKKGKIIDAEIEEEPRPNTHD